MRRRHERTLRVLIRGYRLLLRAYPREFRARFGGEMIATFRTSACKRLEARGVLAIPGLILHNTRDWCLSVAKEHSDMTRAFRLARWVATLPLAMLASYAVLRLVGLAISSVVAAAGFRTLSTPPARAIMTMFPVSGMFAMSAAFVGTALIVAPDRKASVARIALAVVGTFGLVFIGDGLLYFAIDPALWGLCVLAGGAAAYLPWRFRSFRRATV
jgi:hypothetical protein